MASIPKYESEEEKKEKVTPLDVKDLKNVLGSKMF
jgi:hypothetical protein